MPVPLHVPEVLRRYTGDAEVVPVTGSTVREALASLFLAHPAMRVRTLGPDGRIWPYLVLSVNGTEAPRDGALDVALADGDSLRLVGAAEGG
ncbi:MAG: MoaD/ThiS family protein [Planctomycetes bacterium]|nr:MoaD/ThiS family protein [Planctomycetota bacterium]